jgi:hypothetical protein
VQTIVIDRRFCGPPRSGNGGYTCGRVAALIEGPACVRLTAPPPLDTPLQVEFANDRVRLLNGAALVAEGRAGSTDLTAPAPPGFAEAERASARYAGFAWHPFPTCFVCGPSRDAGDGLRIFPGLVEGAAMVAAPWVPDASLADASGNISPEFVWAALDCVGYFAHVPFPAGLAALLGELCARIDARVSPGERCIVTGWSLGAEGRKHYAGSAVFAADGSLVALARATWITVPAAAHG